MKNAKIALVIAEPIKSKAGYADQDTWRSFLASIQKNVKQIEGIDCFHENVWQIPLDNGLPFLVELLRWAGGIGIQIRVLFLEEAPDWIKYPPDVQGTA